MTATGQLTALSLPLAPQLGHMAASFLRKRPRAGRGGGPSHEHRGARFRPSQDAGFPSSSNLRDFQREPGRACRGHLGKQHVALLSLAKGESRESRARKGNPEALGDAMDAEVPCGSISRAA